jgi:hypothetical protein
MYIYIYIWLFYFSCIVIILICQPYNVVIKVKVKGREEGVYSALQLEEADCTLTPNVVPSFISRGAITPSGARAIC